MQTLTQSYNESRTGAWVAELLRSSIYGHKINTTTVGSGPDNQRSCKCILFWHIPMDRDFNGHYDISVRDFLLLLSLVVPI